MNNIFLRPTGLSLIVGQIDTAFGNIEKYTPALNDALIAWNRDLKIHEKKLADDGGNNPADLYKTCGYLGIGPWNFLTFTLVSELGLTSQLAYIGNIRGQSYFHGHDPGLVLDTVGVSGEKRKSLIKLVNILAAMSLPVMIKASKGDTEWLKLTGVKQPLHIPKFAREGVTWYLNNRPFELRHIYSGRKSLYGVGGDQPEGPRSDFADGQDLIGVFQLKLNPQLKRRNRKDTRLVAYLSTLLELHEELQPDGVVVRPMFSSGYFDMLVILRGSSINEMDAVMQRIKTLNTADVKNKLEEFRGLANLKWLPARAKVPLFVLSHTTFGVPYSSVLNAGDKLAVLLEKNEDKTIEPEQLKSWCHEAQTYFSRFAPPASANSSGYEVAPSTSVSVTTTRMDDTITVARAIHKALDPQENDASGLDLTCGRYDLELFKGVRMTLDAYISRVLLFKFLIEKSVTLRLKTGSESKAKPSGKTEILDITTNLAMPFKIDGTSGEHVGNGPNSRHPIDHSFFLVNAPFRRNPIDHSFFLNLLNDLEAAAGQLKKVNKSHAVLAAYEKSSLFWEQAGKEVHYQEQFREYLIQQFGHEVSYETLGMLHATLCSIEGFLRDPLLFHLYLDVAKFIIYNLKVLMTMAPAEKDNNKVAFLDRVRCEVRERTSTRNPTAHGVKNLFHGMEAFILNLVDVLQTVIGQRQPGSFPHHDRGFSRLSDVQVQHARKMLGISWMVNNMIQEMACEILGFFSFFRGPTKNQENEELDSVMSAIEECCRELFRDHQPHLTRFGNTPEVCLSSMDSVIFLHAKLLTNSEGLALVVHELGHYFDRILPRPYVNKKLRSTFNASLWEEIQADLFTFKLCFAQTTLCHHPEIGESKTVYTKVRVLHLDQQHADMYDLLEDFQMSQVNLWMSLPKITSTDGKRSITLRIALTLAILKYATYGAPKGGRDVFQEWIKPFFQGKLKELINRNMKAKQPIFRGSIWQEIANGKYEKGVLKKCFETQFQTFLDGLKARNPHALLRLYLASAGGLKPTEQDLAPFNFPEVIKRRMPLWLIRLLLLELDRGNEKTILERPLPTWLPALIYQSGDQEGVTVPRKMAGWLERLSPTKANLLLSFLCDEVKPSPYLSDLGLNDPKRFHLLLQGVFYAEDQESNSSFAIALRLIGLLNLGLVAEFKTSATDYTLGSMTYREQRVQDNLARVRQLIHNFIARGAWAELRLFLKGGFTPKRNSHHEEDPGQNSYLSQKGNKAETTPQSGPLVIYYD